VPGDRLAKEITVAMTLKHVIEALVFASPKPLLTREIVAALRAAGEGTDDQEARDYAKVKEAEVAALLEELKVDLIQAGRAFQLVEQASGWTLVTDPAAAAWVRQLYPEAKPTRLSGPALETLAIIAYRQPVTRADIEVVRGVAVDGVMQVLLDRSLVKIAGRADVPGRPLLYSTTEYFLQHFGLRAVDELPNADELRRIPLPVAEPAAPPSGGAPAESPAPIAEAGPDENAAESSGEATPAGD
jgi:segregation and condensation protein B